MRTTISLDDHLGQAARERARQEGLSLSAFVARALQQALATHDGAHDIAPFRLITVGGGGPRPGIDLDRTSALLETDDIDQYRPRR